MIKISHRGNISKAIPERENQPKYLLEALMKGYEVECDVWSIKSKLYLGHDSPEYEIETKFLQMSGMWCHAKNIEALNIMMKEGIHCFWHQEDDYTLTSRGWIWTYPGKKLDPDFSILVMPEWIDVENPLCAGICSDNIEKYRLL